MHQEPFGLRMLSTGVACKSCAIRYAARTLKAMKRIPSSTLILTFLLTLAQPMPLQAGPKDQTLDIYWVDAEGGGATLIVTPAGESILIDTGNPGVRDPGRIHKAITETAGLGSFAMASA